MSNTTKREVTSMVWSEIKTTFENEVLCPSLRGRVRFEYTDYAADVNFEEPLSSEDVKLRDSCLAVYADGELLYRFDTKDYTERFSSMNEQLRHTIQKVLSDNYMSRSDAVEASLEIVNEFIPWLSSQKGIMLAEDAVKNMKEFINNPKYNLCTSNEFTFVLWYLSKYLHREIVLSNTEAAKLAYAKRWFYPFIELRIEAEKNFSDTLQKEK